MPNDRKISIMKDFIQVMKPLVDIALMLSMGAQKGITISTVWALLYKLLNAFLQTALSDSRLANQLAPPITLGTALIYTDGCVPRLSTALTCHWSCYVCICSTLHFQYLLLCNNLYVSKCMCLIVCSRFTPKVYMPRIATKDSGIIDWHPLEG